MHYDLRMGDYGCIAGIAGLDGQNRGVQWSWDLSDNSECPYLIFEDWTSSFLPPDQ